MRRIPTITLAAGLMVACGGGAPEAEEAAPVEAPAATEAAAPSAPGDDPALLQSGLLGQWQWVSFQGMDDSTVDVEDPSKYTLTFRTDGITAVADCNRGTAGFTLDGASISFSPIAATQAMCPGESMGETYLRYLGDVRSWVIEDGELHLSLMMDGGILRFRPSGETS